MGLTHESLIKSPNIVGAKSVTKIQAGIGKDPS